MVALEEECWRHDADLEQERGPATAPSWGRPMGAQSGRNMTRRRGTGGRVWCLERRDVAPWGERGVAFYLCGRGMVPGRKVLWYPAGRWYLEDWDDVVPGIGGLVPGREEVWYLGGSTVVSGRGVVPEGLG